MNRTNKLYHITDISELKQKAAEKLGKYPGL